MGSGQVWAFTTILLSNEPKTTHLGKRKKKRKCDVTLSDIFFLSEKRKT